MAALGKFLRTIEGNKLSFWCPGCKTAHAVRVAPGPKPWAFNGDAEKPTFSPSVLVTYDHWVPQATPENLDPGPQTQVRRTCHSLVRDGQIQFLGDCSHELAGQTVPLPEFP